MSLRVAIKRSHEDSTSEITMPNAKKIKRKYPSSNRRGRPRRIIVPAVPVELPKMDKVIRNSDPSTIDEFGFVEISGSILSEQLIKEIYQEAIEKVTRYLEEGLPCFKRRRRSKEIEEISNSLQVDLPADMLDKMGPEVQASEIARNTMQAVFGKRGQSDTKSNYDGFILETPKVLVALPGSNPQLPHADDHCTSCIVCLIHLRDNQEPTIVATYDGKNKDYPTGITVTCDLCNRMQMLPDSDYRRGVHLTDEEWHCNCNAAHIPYDFEGSMIKSFGELLDVDAPNLCDSYCGKRNLSAGEGILALPTMIHRGPGCPSTATDSRYILFFTLRPQYKNVTQDAVEYHKYNPGLQIHAPCVLFNQFKKVKSIYERNGCDLDGYLSTIVGKEAATLMREVTLQKAEIKYLKTLIHPDTFNEN